MEELEKKLNKMLNFLDIISCGKWRRKKIKPNTRPSLYSFFTAQLHSPNRLLPFPSAICFPPFFLRVGCASFYSVAQTRSSSLYPCLPLTYSVMLGSRNLPDTPSPSSSLLPLQCPFPDSAVSTASSSSCHNHCSLFRSPPSLSAFTTTIITSSMGH